MDVPIFMKDPKKVEAGKRQAAINHKKREVKKREEAQNGGMNQYYGTGFSHAFSAGAVIAVGVIGGLGYYIYQTKKGEVPNSPTGAGTLLRSPRNPPNQPSPWYIKLTSLRSLLYYKNGQEEYSK